MKLAKKLKKTVGMMLISTMVLSVVPTMAADYDNHWAKEAITKWSDYGVVTGYGEGIFKPNQQVKRAELAAFIVRVFGLESTEDAIKFTDVPAHAWYAQDVAKVSAAGIMKGASGQFKPNGYATREEVAVTLVNAFDLTGSSDVDFKDQGQIAAWAKEAVAALASNGYAKGQADNRFNPKAKITRAEVVQLLDNIVEKLVHKPGTYNHNIEGNVVVNTSDTVLENMKVDGNVYLAQGIGLGDATLKNTKVTGHVFVAGGGPNSIHFEKAVIEGEIVVDTKSLVRLVAKDVPVSVNAEKSRNFILTGYFEKVVVPADATLELKSAIVEKLIVDGSIIEQEEVTEAAAQIILDETSIIKGFIAQAPAKIDGEGNIEQLKVEANGIITTIKPDEIHIEDGFEEPIYKGQIDEPVKDESSQGGLGESGDSSGSGGTGGSGGSSEKPVKQSIKIKSITLNDTYEMPSSILSIDETNITLDLKEGNSNLPASIEKVAVTLDNLQEGDKVKVVLDLPVLGEIELEGTVEADGEVSYELAALKEKIDAIQKAFIQDLVNQDLYEIVEAFLNEIGLSLETDYLQDGSLDTEIAIAKIQQALAYLEQSEVNVPITRTIRLQVENREDIEDTVYTVTVNY